MENKELEELKKIESEEAVRRGVPNAKSKKEKPRERAYIVAGPYLIPTAVNRSALGRKDIVGLDEDGQAAMEMAGYEGRTLSYPDLLPVDFDQSNPDFLAAALASPSAKEAGLFQSKPREVSEEVKEDLKAVQEIEAKYGSISKALVAQGKELAEIKKLIAQ